MTSRICARCDKVPESGAGEVRAAPISPATRGALIFTVRCDRDCHKIPPIEALKADAT
ncbi:hypothetical protein [Streptomyces milbemycinicus]|uniref:Uncharacterized protein n=1 Tax=Streptomyces milbemycinicus TaxID=476552 RepID=A0ABW8M1B0_9ACTN